jgi:hypothetical protein
MIRMPELRRAAALALLAAALAAALAVRDASAQGTVAIYDAVVVAAAPVTYKFLLFGVKQFANGTVLVNDGFGRRLSAFDSTLQHATIIADTALGSPFNYGTRPAPIIPYLGDTVLFIDYNSETLVMVGPGGKVGRVLAPPKTADLRWIGVGVSGADAAGRLAYQTYLTPKASSIYQGDVRIVTSWPADSSPIVRGDFDTRRVDTIAFVAVNGGPVRIKTYSPSMELGLKETENPLHTVDDWTITSDGSIAMVRGHDYHVDWINPDGSRASTPKMPFDFKRITDADKQRMLDSMRARNDSLNAIGRGGYSPGEALNFGGTAKIVTAPDGTKYVAVDREFGPLAAIPDYYPPIRTGAVKADADGNIWILPTTSAQSRHGGLVYDVVNRKGELFQRVEVPPGRSIAGFGRGGVVYLMNGDRTKGFTLERARVSNATSPVIRPLDSPVRPATPVAPRPPS